MEESSYRLAEYQITLQGGEIRWKTHGGFGNTKSGKCFIEGEVLFIGPCERDEIGFLKTEFLQYLRQFPQWEGTKYYCPSYMLYSCKGRRARRGLQYPRAKGTRKQEKITEIERVSEGSPPVQSKGGIALRSLSSAAGIGQLKGRLGNALGRWKGLVGLGSDGDDSEE